jgi:dTDP-4-amino-4,6-dideoxygalactose transaminase
MNIPLSKPFWGKEEERVLVDALHTTIGTGDGRYSKLLTKRLMGILRVPYVFPVTSCTHAMELAIRVINVGPGDEVIVPSFTMTSTANAIVLSGATPVFADIDPHTYCIDPQDVQRLITKKTKGIMVVHYAGMACEMKTLSKIAKKHKLFIIEDAAHAVGASYFGKALGTFGCMGAFSFHGTKNVCCGEGGVLVTNNSKLSEKIHIFRANGTNRHKFLQGLVAKYHWVAPGSSYFLSDILASVVYTQLAKVKEINARRTAISKEYTKAFKEFGGTIQLPIVPEGTNPNWHIYAVKFPTTSSRKSFARAMRAAGIEVSSHYVALHSSPMGRRIAHDRSLPITDDVAATLVRLPIYPSLTMREIEYITAIARRILKKI